jgi:peptidyl-prolyl cis-trans isomerase SurA
MNEYRKEIREEILLQQVQQQAVGSKITIAPQEVSDFMRSKTWQAFNTKEYHLEDILITLPEVPSPQDVANAKKRAEEVLQKLQHGMSFNEAAAAESGDKNALQGGDLGWRKLPEIPSAFADKLIYLKAGELLGPVQTPNGFHIVRLAGIRSNDSKMTPEQQRMQVEQLIFQRKLEEGLQTWVAKLRGQAFINTNSEAKVC